MLVEKKNQEDMSFNKALVERLKKELGVTKDQDLAMLFGVTPFVFSSWKRSKGKLTEEVVKYGIQNKLDFNKVFYQEVEEGPLEDVSTPIIMAEDLFEYCLSPAKVKDDVARYNFPRIGENSIGFQVISQNMEPTISVGAIALGKEVELSDVSTWNICILHTTNKGIYISRFLEKREEFYCFVNDNELFGRVEFREEEVISVFKVSSAFSLL